MLSWMLLTCWKRYYCEADWILKYVLRHAEFSVAHETIPSVILILMHVLVRFPLRSKKKKLFLIFTNVLVESMITLIGPFIYFVDDKSRLGNEFRITFCIQINYKMDMCINNNSRTLYTMLLDRSLLTLPLQPLQILYHPVQVKPGTLYYKNYCHWQPSLHSRSRHRVIYRASDYRAHDAY